jgi:hypothetical protein
MRKPGFAGLLASLAFLLAPAVADTAAPTHDRSTETIDDAEVCGIPGTATIRFNIISTELGNDTFVDRGTFTFAFTADSTGKSFTTKGPGRATRQEIVDEAAGTLTLIETVSGAPELVKARNGRLLTRDAGLVVNRVRVFELDPVTGEPVDLISDTWERIAGPHPDLVSGFERFCEVLEPYLLDP